MNVTKLSAQIIERKLLRYTPAGIPVCECVLHHQSTQVEAQQDRQIELELNALALGTVAEMLQSAMLGQSLRFNGFLARKSRKSKSFIYHITAFELETEE